MRKENATSNQEHARGTVMSHDGDLTPEESASHLTHAYSKSEVIHFSAVTCIRSFTGRELNLQSMQICDCYGDSR